MQKSSVAAFLATVLVAVPAGWQLLGANIQTDGPALRPPKETFTVDGVTVSVELDRGISAAGGQVKAILVATSDTPKEISLDVRALEDNGYGEERVPNPPTVVSKRRVKVKAGPNGGAPVEVAFNLGTTRHKGSVQWFDIDVMSSKTRYRKNEWEGSDQPNAARYYDYGDETLPQNAARIGFAVWGGNAIPLAFEPTKIPPTGPFEIAVTVKNTKKRAIEWMEVDIGNQLGLEGLSSELMVTAYREDSPYDIETVGDESSEPLEPGATRTYRFKVTPKNDATKKFTFMAHAHGNATGAVETITLERSEAERPGDATVVGFHLKPDEME